MVGTSSRETRPVKKAISSFDFALPSDRLVGVVSCVTLLRCICVKSPANQKKPAMKKVWLTALNAASRGDVIGKHGLCQPQFPMPPYGIAVWCRTTSDVKPIRSAERWCSLGREDESAGVDCCGAVLSALFGCGRQSLPRQPR